MKLYRMIFIVLTIVILYDGFNGEFANPTLFDLIKWVAWLFLTITYLIYHRRKNNETKRNS